jgi:hypothetical protein
VIGRRRILSALLSSALFLALQSCASAPPDRVVQSAGQEEIASLDSLEARLLALTLSPDTAALSGLRRDLDKAAASQGLSRQLQARVEALRGEAALLARDLPAARSRSESAAALSDAEEGVWIVRAALEEDPAKRLAILETGLSKAAPRFRLLCLRGRELVAAGRYAEAAQDLDEGLRGLDPGYRALYGPDRDKAFALARAAQDGGTAVAQPDTLAAQLTIRVMTERAFAETRLLSALSADPKPSYQAALPALSAAGLLLDPAAGPDTPALRKNVAFFLWAIIARAEHDPKLLTRYRAKYTTSPVPDVPTDSPWFDAALGVVEREIMELPDGVHFNPDGPVTGMEYLSMLGRLQKQYR